MVSGGGRLHWGQRSPPSVTLWLPVHSRLLALDGKWSVTTTNKSNLNLQQVERVLRGCLSRCHGSKVSQAAKAKDSAWLSGDAFTQSLDHSGGLICIKCQHLPLIVLSLETANHREKIMSFYAQPSVCRQPQARRMPMVLHTSKGPLPPVTGLIMLLGFTGPTLHEWSPIKGQNKPGYIYFFVHSVERTRHVQTTLHPD